MKIYAVFLMSIVFNFNLYAQIPINGTISTGLFTSGKIQFVEGVLDIKNSPTFQFNIGTDFNQVRDISFEYKINPGQGLEFIPSPRFSNEYSRVSSEMTTHTFGVSGINYLTSFDSDTRPYVTLGFYYSYFDLKPARAEDRDAMTFRLGLGVKHFFSQSLGFQVQASYVAPVQFVGSGLYAGIGTGGISTGLSLNAASLISQGDFTAGLIYRFQNVAQ